MCLAYTITSLRFSTDRNDLISVEEAYRRQFLEFKRDFNIQDNLYVLVESQSRERNRQFVERLAALLQADNHFSDIYYRAGLKLIGPKALMFLPEESLAAQLQELRTHQPLFHTFSQATNLETLFALVNRQFRLLGSSPAPPPPDGNLFRALPALQRVVDSASDYLDSPENPPAPDLTSLFAVSPDQNRRELYLTFDQGRIFMLIARAKGLNQEDAAIRRLRQCIARMRPEIPGVNAELTGEAVLRHDEMDQARHDTEVAALVSLALTALIFIGACRDILRPLMATCCLLIGICYALGFATLTVGRLNILSITLVPILIGLAVDFGVHLILRYEEEVRQGRGRRLAIRKTLQFTGLGVVSNALTIAGAFYFMVVTDFKGMQQMGVIAGSGVLLCLIPMFTLLPLLLVGGKPDLAVPQATRGRHGLRDPLLISLRSSRRAPQQPGRGEHSRRARIGQFYLQHPWGVLACGAGLTLMPFGVVWESSYRRCSMSLRSY